MISKIKFFIEYFKYLNNSIAALQFKFGLEKKCIIKIKNKNLAVELKNVSSIDKLMRLLQTVDDDKYEELINYIKVVDYEKEIKGIGGKRRKLNINSYTTKTYINNSDNYFVEVITIKDVLDECEFPADILKMDCEGYEFEIILNEDLTMFNDIIFEHHSKQIGKDYEPLIKNLEEGFNINTYDVIAKYMSFEDVGIIHA